MALLDLTRNSKPSGLSDSWPGRLLRIGVLVAVAMPALAGQTATTKPGASDTRQKIWAIRLDRLLKEPPGWTAVERHETQELAFSPDDKRLALTVAHYQRVSERSALFNTHLFIIQVNSPEADVQQFDLSQTCGVDLKWNERGDAILVCGTLLRLVDGTTCTVSGPPAGFPSLSRETGPHRAHWLDSGHVIRRNGQILDLACERVGIWQAEPSWQIVEVAASKGWILQWHEEGPRQGAFCQYSVIDEASHRVLSGWKIPCPYSARMAVGAEAYCFSLNKGGLHCKEINAGTEIPVPRRIREYRVIQGSNSSARIIVERWEQPHEPWWSVLSTWWIPVPGFPSLPRQRIVFDLRSGSLISCWKPGIQNSTSGHVEDWPYHCALSASGEFVAESGDGGLETYRLAP
jgi:hypothetical protein